MAKKREHGTQVSMSELLRVGGGSPVSLADHDPRATPGFDGSKSEGKQAVQELSSPLSDLQERLFAAGRGGSTRNVLLVLQGMDTSGKGGTVRHVVGLVDPQGLAMKAFKAPTEEERRHDFLWRIKNALPSAGMIGVFDRSHYEDVLIGRVRQLAPRATITRRYDTINRFESALAAKGTVLVKVMLHISREEQQARLLARLDDPSKYWKYNPTDVDERALWDQYQEAYELVLERTSTEHAPWYVVPGDRKWYRDYAVTRLLIEALQALDPQWPAADFDVEVEKKRVTSS